MNSDKYKELIKERERWQAEIDEINKRTSAYEAWAQTQTLSVGDELLITKEFCQHWLDHCQSPIHLLGAWIKSGVATIAVLDPESSRVDIHDLYGSWSIPLELAKHMREAWLLKEPSTVVGFK